MEDTSLSDFVGDDEREAGGSGGEGEMDGGDVVEDDANEGDAGAGDVASDAGGGGSGAGEPSAGEAGSADSPTDEASEMPAGPVVTAAYRPAGGTCERCEASVGWLWTDDDERLCRGCKDW